MQTRLRALALLAVMSLAAAPALQAETMGTNPKPNSALSGWPMLQDIVDSAFAYLGL